MYKNAVRKKLVGGISAAAVIIVFLALVIIFAEGAPLYLFGGILASFGVLIGFSMKKYVTELNKVKMHYGFTLERDVDSCTRHCSGKYFFLDNCLIDLANARMIEYESIKKVTGISTKGHRSASSGQIYHAGAAAEIHTNDGHTYLFSDFGTSNVKDSRDILEGYRKFCDHLEEYAPWAFPGGEKQQNN